MSEPANDGFEKVSDKLLDELLNKAKPLIKASLEYKEATNGKRYFQITSEIGELKACRKLGLELALDPLTKGFDAKDKKGLKVQIKTRQSQSEGKPFPKGSGSTGIFSGHEFDYALLVILDEKYELHKIYRVDYEKLKESLEGKKSISLSKFKNIGEQLYPV